MTTKTLVTLILILPGLTVVFGKTAVTGPRPATNSSRLSGSGSIFDLAAFGAVGDGVTDDGPALQNALNAIGNAGGGTLVVPAGRYAITTPVAKDFTGLADSVTIQGVASSTVVPPPNSGGTVLTKGLDLVSEFAPRTGGQQMAIKITGLPTFLIKDIGFIGTRNVVNDAKITLALNDVQEATIRHCEFYGLASLLAGGAIVQAVRSRLTVEQTVFLGSTCSSGVYSSVVQNIEWKGITIADTIFVDYGQRAELYGKLDTPPFSWVNIGNAAVLTSDSPRREVTVRNVFLDEGGFVGLSSLPDRYQPPSAPIDLVYVTGLYMNVSNLGTTGHYFYRLKNVLVENSHYGWSHNADSAISLLRVGNAILDQVECVASADRIRADSATGNLTVIDSVYNHLDSLAQTTRVITTNAPDEDPVQYVRQKFLGILGREPDAAAHFYWSDLILDCDTNLPCSTAQRAALVDYLNTGPPATFSISGQVKDENGAPLPAVIVTLSGSQSVATQTDSQGMYSFSKLPTSGVYTVTPTRPNYAFNAPSQTFTTPNNNQVADFAAMVRYTITGRVLNSAGQPLSGATVQLSGSQGATLTTGPTGDYSFNVPAGGNFTVTPSKVNYVFTPTMRTYNNLGSNQTGNFNGSLVRYTISGRTTEKGQGLSGITISLSGSQSATATTDAAGNYSFTLTAEGSYTITPSKPHYAFAPNNQTFNNLGANQTANFVGTAQRVIEFNAASYSVSEGARTITVTVLRAGDTSSSTEVTYSATDGSAQQRSDVSPVIGRLSFQPGETSKSFTILITNDAHVEGDESITLELSDLVGGTLGNNSRATLTITDNDSAPAANAIDDAQFFVRQHYHDFLSRPPDGAGLAFWSNQIASCGTNAACLADRRMNVSAAFFLSIEFQETGFLVYRLYRASFGQQPQHLQEFLLDTRTIGEGIVVNTPGWEQLLEASKAGFIQNFVERSRFRGEYPLSLTPAEFVDLLNTKAGGPLSPNEVAAAVGEFSGAAMSGDAGARARVLRRVAESNTFSQRELNPGFVLMQYFGYLQRNPYDPPDTNLDGYNFWLNKLEEFGGDFRSAEMVKSFLLSTEYRARFGTP